MRIRLKITTSVITVALCAASFGQSFNPAPARPVLEVAGNTSFDMIDRSFESASQRRDETYDFRRTEPGKGTFSFQGDDPLTEAIVVLQPSGEFQITFKGRSTRWVRGTYSSRGNPPRVHLRIDAVSWAQSASGDGTLELSKDRDNFTSLNLSGLVNGRKFSGNFTAGGEWPGGNIKFESRQAGKGKFTYNGDDEIDEAAVTVDSNGIFEISFKGRSSRWVRGTWTEMGDRLNLRITAGSWSTTVSGTGTLTLNRNKDDFTKIDLAGLVGKNRFTGVFEAEGQRRTGSDDEEEIQGFVATERGTGSFAFRLIDPLTEATVTVNTNNSRFEIVFKGRDTRWVRGVWTAEGDRLELRIESASWARTIRGTGILTLPQKRRSFRRISLSGTADRERFSASFTANAGG